MRLRRRATPGRLLHVGFGFQHQQVAPVDVTRTAASFEANRALLSEKTALFRNLLEQHVRKEPEFVLVPDTNALLKSADPALYR